MKVSSNDFPVLYSNICRIQVADKTGHHNHLFRHFTHSHVEQYFFLANSKKGLQNFLSPVVRQHYNTKHLA